MMILNHTEVEFDANDGHYYVVTRGPRQISVNVSGTEQFQTVIDGKGPVTGYARLTAEEVQALLAPENAEITVPEALAG